MADIVYSRTLKLVFTINNQDYVVDGSTQHGGISSGSIKLEKVICDKDIQFGALYSDKLEAKLFNFSLDVNNQFVKLVSTISSVETILFEGIVDSTKKDTRSGEISIVAYDMAYTLRNENVANWWNTFWTTHPLVTLKMLRESLCTTYGITYDDTSLTNDMVIMQSKPCEISSVSFGSMLSSICELECCFPHFINKGKIEFIQLNSTPINIASNYERNTSSYESYITAPITGVCAYDSSGNLSQSYIGDEENTENNYKVVGNIFLLNLPNTQRTTMLTNMYNYASTIQHRPCTVNLLVSDDAVSLGKSFKIGTNDDIHYVMALELSGSLLVDQSIKDVADGQYIQGTEKPYTKDIIEDQKYSSLKQSVDSISSEVFDSSTGQSKITQLAGEIDAKVSSTGGTQVSFGWSLTADGFNLYSSSKTVMAVTSSGLAVSGKITADEGKIANFNITQNNLMYGDITGFNDTEHNGIYLGQAGIRLGKYFSVDTEGNVSATSATLTGALTATSGEFRDGVYFGTAKRLRVGSWTPNESSWTALYSGDVLSINAVTALPSATTRGFLLASDDGSGTSSCITIRGTDKATYMNSSGIAVMDEDDSYIKLGLNNPNITMRKIGDEATYSATFGCGVNKTAAYGYIVSNGGYLYMGSGSGSYVTAGSSLVVYNSVSPAFSLPAGGQLRGNWTQTDSNAITSDRNAKNTINDISDAYDGFFDLLRPRTFKYNHGTSNRLHIGFIAQEIEEATVESGMTTQDSGIFVRHTYMQDSDDGEQQEVTECCLRYDEVIALNTKQIQKLKARVAELERKLSNE